MGGGEYADMFLSIIYYLSSHSEEILFGNKVRKLFDHKRGCNRKMEKNA
jgi:hypothetical protein